MRVRAGRLGFNGGWAWDFRLCGSRPGFSRGAARWAASRHEVLLALGWWYVRLTWGRELMVEGPENTDWLQRRRREGGATDAQEGAEETSHNRGTTNFERDRSDESPP